MLGAGTGGRGGGGQRGKGRRRWGGGERASRSGRLLTSYVFLRPALVQCGFAGCLLACLLACLLGWYAFCMFGEVAWVDHCLVGQLAACRLAGWLIGRLLSRQ